LKEQAEQAKEREIQKQERIRLNKIRQEHAQAMATWLAAVTDDVEDVSFSQPHEKESKLIKDNRGWPLS
jgi:hypothetical protein